MVKFLLGSLPKLLDDVGIPPHQLLSAISGEAFLVHVLSNSYRAFDNYCCLCILGLSSHSFETQPAYKCKTNCIDYILLSIYSIAVILLQYRLPMSPHVPATSILIGLWIFVWRKRAEIVNVHSNDRS